jgi:hypothetical protein
MFLAGRGLEDRLGLEDQLGLENRLMLMFLPFSSQNFKFY